MHRPQTCKLSFTFAGISFFRLGEFSFTILLKTFFFHLVGIAQLVIETEMMGLKEDWGDGICDPLGMGSEGNGRLQLESLG